MSVVLHLVDGRMPASASGLLSLLRRGRPDDRVACVGPQWPAELGQPDEVIRRAWSWDLTAVPGVRSAARRCGATVIHAWSPALADAASATGVAACVTVMTAPADGELESLRSAVATGVVLAVPSAGVAQALRQAGLDGSSVAVVSVAAEVMEFSCAEATELPRGDVRGPRLVVVAPPQHAGDRGPYWAVWALGMVRVIADAVELVIPGIGPAVERARSLAIQSELLSRVRVVGPADREPVWAGADAAVLYDRRGIGLSGLAQALATGVPVIAADAGELAAHLVHQRTALLVEPAQPRLLAQALWRLWREATLGPRLARQARQDLSAMLDVQAWRACMDDLYARLTAGFRQKTEDPRAPRRRTP